MVILISLGGYIHLYNPTPVPLKMNLKELPLMIGDWRWVRTEHLKDSFGVQGADAEVMSSYQNTSGREIKQSLITAPNGFIKRPRRLNSP
jgi:hypothetical protein